MNDLNLVLTIFGGLLLILDAAAGFFKNQFAFSEPLVALLVGVVIGPAALHILDLANWGNAETILEFGAKLTLAIALMEVALRLPEHFFFRQWKSLAVLLGLVMPLMWIASGLLVYFILGIPFWIAILIGAVITPTDPVLASSIVGGKIADENLPDSLRDTISAESGANDALAYPLVILPILFLSHPTGEVLHQWLINVVIWKVLGAVSIGAVIGYGVGQMLLWVKTHPAAEHISLLTVSMALALCVLGAVNLAGSDGLLAVFVSGLILNRKIVREPNAKRERISEAVRHFFDLPIFVLFGMALPWMGWASLGWQSILLVIAILLFRRLPFLLALRPFIQTIKTVKQGLFAGWFGPIGIAALYYAILSQQKTNLEIVWHVGSLLIFASTIIHGITATPLTKLYGSKGKR